MSCHHQARGGKARGEGLAGVQRFGGFLGPCEDWPAQDTLAEWLRRRPAKPMGSPRVGSNPTGVASACQSSHAGAMSLGFGQCTHLDQARSGAIEPTPCGPKPSSHIAGQESPRRAAWAREGGGRWGGGGWNSGRQKQAVLPVGKQMPRVLSCRSKHRHT